MTGALIGAGLVAGGLLLGGAASPPARSMGLPPSGPDGQTPPLFNPRGSRTANTRLNRSRSTQRIVPPRSGFSIPSRGEQRYVPNEVLISIRGAVTPAQLRRLQTRYGLTPLATAHISLLDLDVGRYRIRPGANVPNLIGSLRSAPQFVAAVQPNYLFELQEDALQKPAPEKPPQYAAVTLKLDAAHKIATGNKVLVAVIDTGLDETNPDIQGSVADRFDALGGAFVPLSHGTAMGGVIVAHKTLTGVAPDAQLLAIRAFSNQSNGSNGTGFDILRGLDYAAAHGARIVNMSFAGPEDALLREALAAARRRGIVEIAAAGNAGPNSKPLFPAADPGVIAVTATDTNDKIFAKANRGDYVAVAAPGVNIIAPGVGGAVQFTSGTSVATAHVSGIAAMLLQADGKATPDAVLKILTGTAHRLADGQAGAGAGLVDASAAVAASHH